MTDDEMKTEAETIGRDLAEAFVRCQEKYAALGREIARQVLAQHILREALLKLNGEGLGGGGISGLVAGDAGSQIRGNGFSLLIIDEFFTAPTDLITIEKVKRPNRGPQGDIEPWKRRGRKGR